MRKSLPVLSLALVFACALSGCENPFDVAMKGNTIQSFETFLAEHPDSPFTTQAEIRLEELYLEKARTDQTLEAYDAYLEKYPKGMLRSKAVAERRTFLFHWADKQDTADAWQQFIDEYPRGDRKLKVEARRRLNMAQHRGIVTVGPLSIEQVNLAEDPDGPLDGWGFYADVTVAGEKVVATLMMQIAYLGAQGQILDTHEWPVVAPRTPDRTPIEEEFKVPMKPGETRTFEWTAGDMPAGWSKRATLKPVDIKFLGEDDAR